jgi:hypothetical protein
MTKMITDDGRVHSFVCLNLSHDPPLPMCEKQCKTCFEMDAEVEYHVRKKGGGRIIDEMRKGDGIEREH